MVNKRRLFETTPRGLDRSEPPLRKPNLPSGAFRAVAGQPPVGSGADADVVLVAPIGEIVPAFSTRPSMVRYFVSRQPASREVVLSHLVQRRCAFLIGQSNFAQPFLRRESGAGLDRQLIEREMLPSEGQRLVELASPGSDALAGARIDQIERKPRKSVSGVLDRRDRLVSVVSARSE